VRPARFAIDPVHVPVRSRVVRRHRRVIRIIDIVKTTAWIDLNSISGRRPAWIVISFLYYVVRITVSLLSVV